MRRICVLFLVACAGPDSASRRPSPSPQPEPAPPPTSKAPPAPAPLAQVFADADPGYGFADPDRKAKLAAAFPKIDAAIAEEMKQRNVAGLAFGVVIDGELAYSKGYGVSDVDTKAVPDADTVYRIGSISKSFAALSILSLRDEDALHLDDPLTKWIPEASGLVYPTRDSQPITLRQLLTHTSGLPRVVDFTKTSTEAIFLAQLDKLPLENPPNRQWVYSNLGFALLGIVAAHANHSSVRDVLSKRVFAPLGMTATTTELTDVPAGKLAPAYIEDNHTHMPKIEDLGVAAGAGGIFSTVRDMARYVAFQMSAYPPRSGAETGPVRRSTIREAHSTGVLSDANVAAAATPKKGEPTVRLDSTAYGFGWQHHIRCNDDDIVEHGGAIDSYRASASFMTNHGVGFVVLTNFGNTNTFAFAERAADVLAATGALQPYVPGRGKISPALDTTIKAFMAIYNKWDEAAIKALLARPLDPVEHDELAGYFKLHGACTAYEPIDVKPNEIRARWTCERGDFEMVINPAPDGRLGGFIGTSKKVAVPPEAKAAEAAILSLVSRWDDRVFERAFADPKTARGWMKPGRDQIFAEAGNCKSTELIHEGLDWRFNATCDRGPDRRFDMALKGGKIEGVRTRPLKPTICPIK